VSEQSISRRAAFRMGASRAIGVPGLVLFASFFGFGAFTHAAGLDVFQSTFITVVVFALPGQVVLVDQISSGAGLAAAIVAVTLTAVRLLPMTVAILPVLRRPDQPVWKQMAMSHFVAVTVWIESMRRLPELDGAARVPYYLGIAAALWPICIVATVLGYTIAGEVPVPVAAALLLLTPLYFLLSMLAAARLTADWLAVAAGLCLGPVFYRYAPGLDLLWTGLVGGTAAFVVTRGWRT
jgi:predicted branched-subunit amino acid permease